MKFTHVFKSSRSLKKQKDGSMSKGPRNQPERAVIGQIWNSLSNTLNYITFEINTYQFMLISD